MTTTPDLTDAEMAASIRTGFPILESRRPTLREDATQLAKRMQEQHPQARRTVAVVMMDLGLDLAKAANVAGPFGQPLATVACLYSYAGALLWFDEVGP